MTKNIKIFQVTFGVMQHNMNTAVGAMAVARDISKEYIPHGPKRIPHKTAVFGDQGTFERLNNARKVAASADTPETRLQGIEPAGQEFHKRGIFNQVCIHLSVLALMCLDVKFADICLIVFRTQ